MFFFVDIINFKTVWTDDDWRMAQFRHDMNAMFFAFKKVFLKLQKHFKTQNKFVVNIFLRKLKILLYVFFVLWKNFRMSMMMITPVSQPLHSPSIFKNISIRSGHLAGVVALRTARFGRASLTPSRYFTKIKFYKN